MVLLRSKELAEKTTTRPRSGTFVLQSSRRRPSEIPRSVTLAKEVEEWKRPGEKAPDVPTKEKEEVVQQQKEQEEVLVVKSPRRRLWSTRASSGLKEDLANNGSLESVIQMGNELLEGLTSADPDEVAYREEQALFWFEKAAERGSSEAKDLIKKMVQRNSTGINASNRCSLKEALTLSDEELSGKRIGCLLHHSSGENESSAVLVGSLIGQSKLESECLSRSDLMLCGKEYMKGRLVPEIDGKLISAESPSSSISLLINRYILLVYYLQCLISVFLFKNVYVYFILVVLLHQYWMFISSTAILQGAVLLIFVDSSFKLLHRPLEKRRFDVWTDLWQKNSSKSGISQKEIALARQNFSFIHTARFALTASLSIGVAEYLWGPQHPFTTALVISLIPLLFIFESLWVELLVTLLAMAYHFYLEPYSRDWAEEFQMALGVGSMVFVLCLRQGSNVLPQVLLLKALDFFVCSSYFHQLTSGTLLLLSLYYGLQTFRRRGWLLVILGVVGLSLGGLYHLQGHQGLSDLTLQKYTSLCPSQYDCHKVEGLKVKWSALEVVSVKQKLLRHPLNEVLRQFALPQEFRELDFNYCDLGLIHNGYKESLSTSSNKDDEVLEESLFSFNFGSPSEEKDMTVVELVRKTIRARIWKTELCKTLREGSLIDIFGVTSSMTSDVDVITYP